MWIFGKGKKMEGEEGKDVDKSDKASTSSDSSDKLEFIAHPSARDLQNVEEENENKDQADIELKEGTRDILISLVSTYCIKLWSNISYRVKII